MILVSGLCKADGATLWEALQWGGWKFIAKLNQAKVDQLESFVDAKIKEHTVHTYDEAMQLKDNIMGKFFQTEPGATSDSIILQTLLEPDTYAQYKKACMPCKDKTMQEGCERFQSDFSQLSRYIFNDFLTEKFKKAYPWFEEAKKDKEISQKYRFLSK